MTVAERPQILQDREKTHGAFLNNAVIWHRLLMANPFPVPGPGADYEEKSRVHAQVLALHMIYCKLSRILAGNSMCKDHWIDIAGYAQLGAEACDDGGGMP